MSVTYPNVLRDTKDPCCPLPKPVTALPAERTEAQVGALGPLSPCLGYSTGRRGLRGWEMKAKNHPLERELLLWAFLLPLSFQGPLYHVAAAVRKPPQGYPSWLRLLPTMQKPR